MTSKEIEEEISKLPEFQKQLGEPQKQKVTPPASVPPAVSSPPPARPALPLPEVKTWVGKTTGAIGIPDSIWGGFIIKDVYPLTSPPADPNQPVTVAMAFLDPNDPTIKYIKIIHREKGGKLVPSEQRWILVDPNVQPKELPSGNWWFKDFNETNYRISPTGIEEIPLPDLRGTPEYQQLRGEYNSEYNKRGFGSIDLNDPYSWLGLGLGGETMKGYTIKGIYPLTSTDPNRQVVAAVFSDPNRGDKANVINVLYHGEGNKGELLAENLWSPVDPNVEIKRTSPSSLRFTGADGKVYGIDPNGIQVITTPLPKSPASPLKTSDDSKAQDQFINPNTNQGTITTTWEGFPAGSVYGEGIFPSLDRVIPVQDKPLSGMGWALDPNSPAYDPNMRVTAGLWDPNTKLIGFVSKRKVFKIDPRGRIEEVKEGKK